MEIGVLLVVGQLERFPGQNKAGYNEEDVDHWSAGVDNTHERQLHEG